MPSVTTRAPASAKQTWRKVMHNSYGQLNHVICNQEMQNMDDSTNEDAANVADKRSHVPSGSTPHKPPRKRSLVGPSPLKAATKLTFTKQPSPTQRAAKYLVTRAKGRHSPKQLTFSPKQRRNVWTSEEDKSLIEFIALHRDLQPTSSDWPSMRVQHKYWEKAAQFIKENAQTVHFRPSMSIRSRVSFLKTKFSSVDNAEDNLGLTVSHYMSNETPCTNLRNTERMSEQVRRNVDPLILTKEDKILLIKKYMETLTGDEKVECIQEIYDDRCELLSLITKLFTKVNEKVGVCQTTEQQLFSKHLDELYFKIAVMEGIRSNPKHFITTSIKAMKRLQAESRCNLVYKFCQMLTYVNNFDQSSYLMRLDRMPFGLLDYVIQFFTCTNTRQICEPEDYRIWLETMETEFPSRFHRLFAGPMWSNQETKYYGNPHKALTNVPCTSLVSHWSKSKKYTSFSPTTDIQVSALDQLKQTNGRFWIKIDGTDIKTALMESARRVWNGDVDMNDGELKKLREQYENHLTDVDKFSKSDCQDLQINGTKLINMFKNDIPYLMNGFQKARAVYHEKFQKQVPNKTLKELNWDIVEHNTLLQQSQLLCENAKDTLESAFPDELDETTAANIRKLAVKSKSYLCDIYKKRRTAASHVLVTMLSDERRAKKPYALPVRFIAYESLKDQQLRDFNRDIKRKMVERGLKVVGTVTDGEFCSLRSRGETRPLHIWQLIHDSKEAVQKMSKKTLLAMLIKCGESECGDPVVKKPNAAIPHSFINLIHNLQISENLTLEDAVKQVRNSLVPVGNTPYPFKKDTEESFLDMLRSLVATCIYRDEIKHLKGNGVDFSLYIYVPEVDPITKDVRHDRSDHNHLFRRAVKSIRDGNHQGLNFEAFDDVLLDPGSGLTHAALIGLRKQSLVDAERLVSKFVVRSLRKSEHEKEAQHVELLVNWHEATDGRSLTQLQRCRYNYNMLNYILDEWMPWHKDCYDFSTIDINRPTNNICGFSRETLVEMTTNIESQEFRRRENDELGYAEHPRAGGTDDLETLFSIAHRKLGTTFTLKDWTEYWPKLVREFCKRMDNTLPFYYWTINERYTEEDLPSFDHKPNVEENVDERHHPLRLHRLKVNRREDASIFAPGRAFLPSRNCPTIRQRLHRHEVCLPPIMENEQS